MVAVVIKRMQAYVDKANEEVNWIEVDAQYTAEVRSAMRQLITQLNGEVHTVRTSANPPLYCQHAFDISVGPELRFISIVGVVRCNGSWTNPPPPRTANCAITGHVRRPYDSLSARKKIEDMQLDHMVGRAHMLQVYLGDAVTVHGNTARLNTALLVELFFGMGNLRPAMKPCHDSDKVKEGKGLPAGYFILPS